MARKRSDSGGTAPSAEQLWDELYTPLDEDPQPEAAPETPQVDGIAAALEDGTQVLLVNRIPDGQPKRKTTARGHARRALRVVREAVGALVLMFIAYYIYYCLSNGLGFDEGICSLLHGAV